MEALKIIGRRLAFGVVAAWGVLTTVFVIFTLFPDWVAQRIEGSIRGSMGGADPDSQEAVEAMIEEALAQYAADRGFDRPLYEQYLDWMGNMVTLQWGESLETGDPVLPTVMDATVRTAMYVVPAVSSRWLSECSSVFTLR